MIGLLAPVDHRLSLIILPPHTAVGGIMAFLALNELLPLAIEHAGRQAAVAALFVGMAIMSGNLFLLHNYLMTGDHDGGGHAHSNADHGH